MILYIDTSRDTSLVKLITDEGSVIKELTFASLGKVAERLVPSVEKAISSRPKEKITGIIVVRGPGSFTSLRLGVAAANALSLAWQVPVVGILQSEDMKGAVGNIKDGLTDFILVRPHYSNPPHITEQKSGMKGA